LEERRAEGRSLAIDWFKIEGKGEKGGGILHVGPPICVCVFVVYMLRCEGEKGNFCGKKGEKGNPTSEAILLHIYLCISTSLYVLFIVCCIYYYPP